MSDWPMIPNVKKRIAVVLLAGLVISIVTASLGTTYWVGTKTTRSQLLWNDEEAYLFVGARSTGWRFSYLRLLGELALALLQTSTPPHESRPHIEMFKINSLGVERYLLEKRDVVWPSFTVFQGRIHYGMLRQWTGSQFEPVTPDQQRRYLEAHISEPNGDYSNVNGWSNRYFSVPPPPDGRKYTVALSGHPIVLTVTGKEVVSIDLQRDDRAPERLLSLALGGGRMVTKTEYVTLFRR
jgi:hypothetical protein